MIDPIFWKNKKVFVTGHTGFKGSWLCMWLHSLGAEVTGYALAPPTSPALFELCRVGDLVHSVIADVRDYNLLSSALLAASPEVVVHMAAQPLVRDSYLIPVETFSTNVMGTVLLLEAVRHCSSVRAVVNVTTDKCYENKEWIWGYRETDQMGGYDPYSSSKGCAELVTAAYRRSFFGTDHGSHSASIASARAGNVIGGGDWASDRLIPDCVRALLEGRNIAVRNPHAIRPWQHVLEPLSGYLLLAQRLCQEGSTYASAWNFGPGDDDTRPVEWIVQNICSRWGRGASFTVDIGDHPHEANYLKLDCSKARTELGWRPKWDLNESLERIVQWTNAYCENKCMRDFTMAQIEDYCAC
ncbi:CDP-glucose 4,6-dehydratase [Geomonas agri]|uniref:CDP-glucose 4,6-dehydratase n=1 Tax=Geomonas agri TaxID=2873702 RepID=UPI001CD6D6BA|nr:CDP-glucose 4,6-dehydratase [Geomonas agri]